MEIALIIIVAAAFVIYNRLNAAIKQVRKEHMVREVVRRMVQKRRIDELYGRDDEARRSDKTD